MASVKVRNIEIGEGLPKICVPIVEKEEKEILEAAKKSVLEQADMIEWRVDWFAEIFDFQRVQEVLGKLRGILEDRPILFTCRTTQEGGQIALTKEQYKILNQYAIACGFVDLVDIEVYGYAEIVSELIDYAHDHNTLVVGSNHDFKVTPPKAEMIRRLVYMQEQGVDIPKIAVMPQNKQDVLELLSATEEMIREHGSTPVITMSMGPLGIISRIAGKVFGSGITFGTVGKSSAPGQIGVEELRDAIKILK